MSQVFGSEAPRKHQQTTHQGPTRSLVVIDAGGTTVARLFLADRSQVAEFDAGAEEVASMIRGRVPVSGATGPEWDLALQGHSRAERAGAAVYVFDV